MSATPSLDTLLDDASRNAVNLRLLGCRAFLERIASWSKIVEHVRADPGYGQLANPNARRQYERTLKDVETGVIAVLLVIRHYQGIRPYTLGELASTIAGEKNTSAWKAAQQRIKLLLARVGDHYGLVRYSVVPNPRDGQSCYQISASDKLVRFVEDTLLGDGVSIASGSSPNAFRPGPGSLPSAAKVS
jgi:hypothetical protein